MSVINHMLQDLQDRKSALASNPALVMPAVAKPPGKQRLLVLMVGGGALIAAAAYGPWPTPGHATAAHLPKPIAISSPAPDPVAASASQSQATVAPSQRPQGPTGKTASVAPHAASLVPASTAKPAVNKPLAGAVAASAPASAAAGSAPAQSPPLAVATVDKRVLSETPRQRAQNFYRQGAEQASTGHVRQAVDLALDALKADPTYAEARQFAVALMYEQQRVAEAEALARDGLAMSRQQGQLAYLLARMLIDRGSKQEAVALLDQQLNLSADGHGLRAGILSQAGDFKRASQDYQSAAMQQPDNSLWWFGLGVALEALGQPQEARRVYAKAQSLGMDRPELSAFIDQKLRTLN